MKNIVLVIDDLKRAGAEQSTVKLANAFIERNYNVSLIIIKNIVEFEISNKINLISLNYEKGKVFFNNLYYAKKLKNTIDSIEQKSGKINFISVSLGLSQRLMSSLNFDNAYYMLRGNTSNAKIGKRTGIKKAIKTLKLKNLYNNKNIICVSMGVEEDIMNIGVHPKTVKTIYNPYDFNYIKEMSLKELECTIPKDKYLIHVGRFSKVKRHDILINAFYKLKNKEMKLLLLGEGDEEDNIKKLVKELGLEDRVLFLGLQSNPYPLMKNATLLLLSSDNEGLPSVIIESLILGVRVVSTDCPSGPKEILKKYFNKYLSLVGNVDDFKDKIELSLLNNNEKIPIDIIDAFSKERVVEEYEKLFT